MSPQTATWIGTIVGGVFLVVHLLYGRYFSGEKNWPPPMRLLTTLCAGPGFCSGLQLGHLVLFTPPPGVSINIDDYRITLFLGVISVIGVSTYALRDNYLAMKRPKAKRRLKT